MKVAFVNLGCPKNQVDLENILGGLSDGVEITTDFRKAEAVLVNTCAFIRSAKEESINEIFEIARLKNEGYPLKLLVTGCLPQRYRNELAPNLPEVDAFFYDTDVTKVAQNVRQFLGLSNGKINTRKLLSPPHYAYLKIATGCDNRCSYCVIPLIKGRYQSRPFHDIVQEAAQLVEGGVKELILTAQDITTYGKDLQENISLSTLLESLNLLPELHWIRILYTHPAHWSEELIESVKGFAKVCKYVDLPIQHISDRILERMGRRVSRNDIEQLINRLRNRIPNLAIRTSLIVGFPGESELEFGELLDFISDVQFERLGVFTYSPEEGTTAFLVEDDVSEELKQDRAQTLMEVQADIALKNNMSMIGKKIEVLIDKDNGTEHLFVGRTQWDAPEVDNQALVSGNTEPGKFEIIEVTGADTYDLIGSILHEHE